MQLTIKQEVKQTIDVEINVPITIRRKDDTGALTVYVGEWPWDGPLTFRSMGDTMERIEREFREAAKRYPGSRYPGDNYHTVIKLALAGEPIEPKD